jgi:cation/acetate symporter
VFFSPTVSGPTGVFWTSVDFSWFPLANPGIISIPAGFLFGILGTLSSREPEAEAAYVELEVRALTGAGAEQATEH